MNLINYQKLLSIVSLMSLLVFGLIGCEKEQIQEKQSPAPVRLSEVTPATFRETVSGIGTLQAAQRVEIRPDATGFVREIRFERGDTVETGQILIILDADKLTQELEATLAEKVTLQTRLAKARRTLRRIRNAEQRGAATAEELDAAQTEFSALQSQENELSEQIELIRERIEDTRIRAPVNGTLTDPIVDVGDYVSRGEMLATLYSNDAMEVRFTVGQQALGKIRHDQTAILRVDAWPDRVFRGTVSYIAPAVLESTRELPVIAIVDDPKNLLKPGVFASVELTTDVRQNVPSVPEESLVATRSGYVVFTVNDKTADKRSVKVGLRKPGLAEIRSGLRIGEKVVRTGHLRLSDGNPVRVLSEKTTRPAATTRRTTQPTTKDGAP